jgi:mono/diheme cytochrome c family protein
MFLRRFAATSGLVLAALVRATAAREGGPAPSDPAQEREPVSQQRLALPAQKPVGDVERGRYLVTNVAMCVECHSPRDERGDIVRGQEFTGAPIPFPPPWPGWALRAPRNRGLPGYTTPLAIRLLTQGAVDREGRQLRPPMPRFRMSLQDAADVVAYLKSLE